jgi:hypothetical protein
MLTVYFCSSRWIIKMIKTEILKYFIELGDKHIPSSCYTIHEEYNYKNE